jgi:acetyl-CoA carboxylase biotin carboxyl carrier protein
MKVEELRQVVHWLEDARIGDFEIERDDCRLRMVLQFDGVRGNPLSVTIDDGEDRGHGAIVAAEGPGIFLIQHPQHAAPIVSLGEPVHTGDLLGLIQIGSIYAPVIASTDGTLAKILAVPQTLVGFGTPLFEIV